MITLVLGGTRSGKSAVAERLAARTGTPVTYVATAAVTTDDPDHRARIATHRARRPEHWRTVECGRPGQLLDALGQLEGTVLVDSLGSWVASHPDLDIDAEALVAAMVARAGATVVVSEEVGSSVHPVSELGRRYVDTVGELNQRVAAVATQVLLVVAGRALVLPGEGGDPS